MRGLRTLSLWNLVLAAAYFGLALVGLSLFTFPESTSAAVMWLPSGLSAAAVLVVGPEMLPGIFAGAVLVNLANLQHHGAAPEVYIPLSICIGAGNSLEAVCFWCFLRNLDIRKLRDAVVFVPLGALSCSVSALVGVGCLVAFLGGEFGIVFATWLIGDFCGFLVLTPLMISVKERLWGDQVGLPWRVAEGALTYSVIICVVLFLFGAFAEQRAPIVHIGFLALLWGVARFGMLGIFLSALVLCTISTIATTRGHGPFVGSTLGSLYELQVFVVTVALKSIVLYAYLHREERIRRRLKRHQATLQQAVQVRTAQLHSAKKEAERAAAAKGEFLANMSHEIRTPLNVCLGSAQLLQEHADTTAEQQRLVRTMMTSGRHLLMIINDILDMSKLEAGMVSVNPEEFCIYECVEDAVLLSRTETAAVSVRYFVDPTVPRFCTSDVGRIKQVLVNLLGNAIKFTPEGSVELRVSTAQGKLLSFAVKDTGIGIPAGKLETIFSAFTQSDSMVSRKFGGTGLGLTISKHIAELLKGSISATSREGAGSTFTFRVLALSCRGDAGAIRGVHVFFERDGTEAMRNLERMLVDNLGARPTSEEAADVRVRRLTDAELEVKRCRNGAVRVVPPFLTRVEQCILELTGRAEKKNDAVALDVKERNSDVKILVVEDNKLNTELISQMLARLGYRRVQYAADGADAVRKAPSCHLVLMDIHLPVMSGTAATRRILRTEPGKIVLAMTADAMRKSEYESEGFSDVVLKPIMLPDLEKKLAKWCAPVNGEEKE